MIGPRPVHRIRSSATPAEIRAMTVVATIVGGTPAFCADAKVCPTANRP